MMVEPLKLLLIGFAIFDEVKDYMTIWHNKKSSGNLISVKLHGGVPYMRLIKNIKGVLHKTLGRTHLSFAQLETIVLDIEHHMNSRPLTYVESGVDEDQVLTPNVVMWGQNSHILEDIEVESESLNKFQRRQQHAREHAWRRRSREYVRSLMEKHRMKRSDAVIPGVGEIVLVVGEQKSRGIWMKREVLRHIKGRDGIVRGAVLLHKGHEIERPLELATLSIGDQKCRSWREGNRWKREVSARED